MLPSPRAKCVQALLLQVQTHKVSLAVTLACYLVIKHSSLYVCPVPLCNLFWESEVLSWQDQCMQLMDSIIMWDELGSCVG